MAPRRSRAERCGDVLERRPAGTDQGRGSHCRRPCRRLAERSFAPHDAGRFAEPLGASRLRRVRAGRRLGPGHAGEPGRPRGRASDRAHGIRPRERARERLGGAGGTAGHRGGRGRARRHDRGPHAAPGRSDTRARVVRRPHAAAGASPRGWRGDRRVRRIERVRRRIASRHGGWVDRRVAVVAAGRERHLGPAGGGAAAGRPVGNRALRPPGDCRGRLAVRRLGLQRLIRRGVGPDRSCRAQGRTD